MREAGRVEAPRLLVVEHEADAGLGRFAAPLGEAGLDVDVLAPYAGRPVPRRIDGYAGLVVLGGAAAAWEDQLWPWLPDTRALLVSAVESAVPVLAVCLGAQLLAVATGGRVERGAAGAEIGVREVVWRAEAAHDPLLGGLGPRQPVVHWHQDAVVELPPGAEWLVEAASYPYQAFRLAGTAWGVQFHPEVTVEGFRSWVEADPEAGAADGLVLEAELRRLAARDAELDEIWRPVVERFAGLVGRGRSTA